MGWAGPWPNPPHCNKTNDRFLLLEPTWISNTLIQQTLVGHRIIPIGRVYKTWIQSGVSRRGVVPVFRGTVHVGRIEIVVEPKGDFLVRSVLVGIIGIRVRK